MPYVVPTAAELKLRYPAFAAVPDVNVDYWIADAQLTVTTGWIEADYQPAILSLAAYNLAANGFGAAAGPVGDLAAMGVTSFKSASMSVSFAESVIAKTGSGYASNRYGAEFSVFLRRNTGGPYLAGIAC